ncbi:DNA replication/repair protein RecF [Microbulbifer salipaludis]|uniref:DNA replication and repair protein RecF n=1 Tax=Microbulbifer salipaludis TaxID=187980 RepID=A0ABS3E351_9GAMM|nr:DNA replication/repair protein RecF [Microbulbifer salipaludis]MBN8429554.1 DNA replication/repair protein RecF [Microbulbifer salipaludis]
MALTRLALRSFRNIAQADLSLGATVVLFCGANGSGKTSLLEAVHMLGTGRSFRSRQSQGVIQYESEALTVFGRLHGGRTLGVEKRRDGQGRIRVNQTAAESSSQLAACLPLQVIDSESFAALDGGPGVRRQLLDWTVFHVEHSFAGHWKAYQSALKQRNALLRRGKIDSKLLAPWELQLVRSGEIVDALRRTVFEKLYGLFMERLSDLPAAVFGDLDIHYRGGWKKDLSLREALDAGLEGDLSQGFTRVGPHRADIRFVIHGQPAHLVLSRGQQKMAVCALRTAMAAAVDGTQRPVFLVDDLPSELDANNQALFARWISGCASQVLVTGIDHAVTAQPWLGLPAPWCEPKMFHVEHGTVREAEIEP